jgi:hypothetical protein
MREKKPAAFYEYGHPFRLTWGKIGNWLLGGGLALLGLLGGIFLLFWTYQFNTYVFRLNIGDANDAPYLKGFSAPQTGEDGNDYRWTSENAWLGMNYPSAPFELTFRAWATHPDNRPVEVEITVAGDDVRRYVLDARPQEYVLRSRKILFTPEGLEIAFRPLVTFTSEDGTPRGIQLDWLEVRQASSRFGPTIPPPFIGFWWLLIGSLPLLVGQFARLPYKSSLILMLGTMLIVNGLYLLPPFTAVLREKWLLLGIIIGLVQVAGLLAVALRLRRRLKPLTLSPLVPPVILIGLLLLVYITTHDGRLTTPQELQAMATGANWSNLEPTEPIDFLLPEPPPGQINPPFAPYGPGFGAFAGTVYRAAQRVGRALPYFYAESVGYRGLLAYILTYANLLLTIATALWLYWLVRRLGYLSLTAFSVALLFGLATSAWVYGRTFWFDPLAEFLLLLAFGGAVLAGRKNESAFGWLIFSGVWFGALIAVQPTKIFLAPVFAVYLALVWRKRAQGTSGVNQFLARVGRRLAAKSGSGAQHSFRPGEIVPTLPPVQTFRPGEVAPGKATAFVRQGFSVGGAVFIWFFPALLALVTCVWYNLARFNVAGQFGTEYEKPATLAERLGQFANWIGQNPPLLLGVGGALLWWKLGERGVPALVLGTTLAGIFAGLIPLEPQLLPFLPLWLMLSAPLIERAIMEHLAFLQLAILLVGVVGGALQLRQILTPPDGAPPFAFTYYQETALAQFVQIFHPAAALALVGWLSFGALLLIRARK